MAPGKRVSIKRNRVTPSTARLRSNVRRSRKQLKSKKAEEKPSWTEALKRKYAETEQVARGKAVDERPWLKRQKEEKRDRELAQVHGKGGKRVAASAAKDGDDEADLDIDDPELDAEIDAEMEAMMGGGKRGAKGARAGAESSGTTTAGGKGGRDLFEVQGDVDPEKEKRLNEKQPLEKQMFLKGLPQDVTETDLAQHLSRFGKVKKIFIVKNTVTGAPSGSAFVHFTDGKAAASLLEHAEVNARELATGMREEQKEATTDMSRHKAKELLHKLKHQQVVSREPFMHYGNTRVSVLKPMTRTDAQEFIGSMHKGGKKANKTPTGADDPRHLYLLREGLIEAGTPAAKGLPPMHLNGLLRDYEERKAQVRNVNFFISLTRLSVRNLPRDCDDKKLKAIFLEKARVFFKKNPELKDKSLWGKWGPIRQCRIMLDTKGQSKRFAFVEMCSHELALYCLRMINNNPEVFGPSHRPVISFAIEDANALQRRQQKKENAKRRSEREATDLENTQKARTEVAAAAAAQSDRGATRFAAGGARSFRGGYGGAAGASAAAAAQSSREKRAKKFGFRKKGGGKKNGGAKRGKAPARRR